jgi:thymidylate synthase (FAD)
MTELATCVDNRLYRGVLDHGFVILRNLAGPTRRPWNPSNAGRDFRQFDADDTDPANAARMSFDGSDQERTYEVEMKLNRYLLKNQHMTPFEMIQVWLEIKMPIFVARQLVRHRTQGINEVSGRYVELPAEWYIPRLKDVVLQAADKKQGGKPVDLDDPGQVARAASYIERLDLNCLRCYQSYEQSIADGIAMEQARLDLHLNHYTHWISTLNLRNLMHLLALRDHSHAQGENQKYAVAITELLEPHIPGLMALYREIVRGETP